MQFFSSAQSLLVHLCHQNRYTSKKILVGQISTTGIQCISLMVNNEPESTVFRLHNWQIGFGHNSRLVKHEIGLVLECTLDIQTT
jgi:hypothetical protein